MSKEQDTSKLWGGRFSEPTDSFVQRFTASVNFDQRMAAEDIAGSLAHAQMLCSVGVLSAPELQQIQEGLATVQREIDEGSFQWSVELEDVHMNIEARLTELIGVTGKKLHTGRSRNDQVATDIRLFLRSAIDRIASELTRLQAGTITLAAANADTIMPGFTHLQTAQPVSFGHHLLAWNEMLERDYGRLMDCRARMNQSPLGAAALAGTTYPIDRAQTAAALGFDKPTENSLDSVSDRDFAIEFCSFAALLLTHLSRMSEELVVWASAQFNFIELPDRFCTGSSIMPQKKNPDVPELVRGKVGRVNGHLVALLTLMKSQPLAYNKDNQEDKEPLFDTVDTVLDCLRAFGDMLPAIKPRREQMREAARSGFSTATDLADYLVGLGLPFRDAHEVVGKAVAHGVATGMDLAEMELATLQGFCADIGDDVFEVLTLEGSIGARDHLGGTAPNQVAAAAQRAQQRLAERQ
ncbi:argininosuccinate lyase [Pseudohalioglobus lutimaris]|uniref:Argininosuccinate lyase n=1 Tax=Pseudohalioglobus lutimaris TaxID=1737061 RepID=A0A2N5X1Y4_9GAMM|nr:argininosuccinate lyase [Pseudohalioglobus lutimaris]PLW68496.1 argininosuccinate lyase [Pseudohalioglobus lutimaris]